MAETKHTALKLSFWESMFHRSRNLEFTIQTPEIVVKILGLISKTAAGRTNRYL